VIRKAFFEIFFREAFGQVPIDLASSLREELKPTFGKIIVHSTYSFLGTRAFLMLPGRLVEPQEPFPGLPVGEPHDCLFGDYSVLFFGSRRTVESYDVGWL